MAYNSSYKGSDIDAAANLVKNGGTINGSLGINGGLGVNDDVSFNGNVEVNAPLQAYAGLEVEEPTHLYDELEVDGRSTFYANATVNGDLTIGSEGTPKNLIVYGTTDMEAARCTTLTIDDKEAATKTWTNAQGFLVSKDISGLAPKASPTFTGTVTLPSNVVINNLANKAGLLKYDEGVLKTDTTAYLTTHQDISGKQDVISDLDTIRTGASDGTSAKAVTDHLSLGTGGYIACGSIDTATKYITLTAANSQYFKFTGKTSGGLNIQYRGRVTNSWYESNINLAKDTTLNVIENRTLGHKEYDLSSLSASNFYPLITGGCLWYSAVRPWSCEITSQIPSGEAWRAQSHIRFYTMAANTIGLSPYSNHMIHFHDYNVPYDQDLVGCIGYTTPVNYSGADLFYVVWLRGGYKYIIESNLELTLCTSQYTKNNITINVGSKLYGDDNENVSYLFNPETGVGAGIELHGDTMNAKYGSTSYLKISRAIKAGMNVQCKDGSYIYRYQNTGIDYKDSTAGLSNHYFVCNNVSRNPATNVIDVSSSVLRVDTNNTWRQN